MHEQHDNANKEQLEHPVEQQEVSAESTRRSTCETRPIERLEPKMSGKPSMQEQKKVNFDVMTCDIPNAFIQALMPEVKDGEERVMMKITGVLAEMLVKLNPELYGPYVVYEGNRRNKVLYVQVMRAIYGMLEAAILWYKKFR
jgi:hypothetical protein